MSGITGSFKKYILKKKKFKKQSTCNQLNFWLIIGRKSIILEIHLETHSDHYLLIFIYFLSFQKHFLFDL